MNRRTYTFAALLLTLALTTPALGGIIHSDAPAPAPTPPPQGISSTETGTANTTDGIIHSDVAATDTTTDPITAAAMEFARLLMSLI